MKSLQCLSAGSPVRTQPLSRNDLAQNTILQYLSAGSPVGTYENSDGDWIKREVFSAFRRAVRLGHKNKNIVPIRP